MSNVRHYYNDVDPVACEWTRELIRDGLIPDGDVDCRSICEVQADEIRGYTQWHFFCGLSGWPLALRLAGVDPARPLLTGSAPCQPFSSAGKRKGTDDERHLWPELLRIISELRPPVALGEQVASRLGREWLARVRTDLEALGYAVGASDLPAGGCGAPHKRQRLFWGAALRGRGVELVANVPGEGCRRRAGGTGGRDSDEHERLCHAESVAEPMHSQRGPQRDADGGGARGGDAAPGVGAEGGAEPVGNAIGAGPQGRGACIRGGSDDRARGGSPATAGDPQPLGDTNDEPRTQRDIGPEGRVATSHRANTARSGAACVDPWSDYDIILCGDGKHRRIPKGSAQSCVLELADGLPDPVAGGGLPCRHAYPLAPAYPGRVALLRGIGNAISPQVGAVFVRAFFEAVEEQNG